MPRPFTIRLHFKDPNNYLWVHFNDLKAVADLARLIGKPITKKTRHIWLRDTGREAFGKLIGQTVTEKTRYIWFPEAEPIICANKRYVQGDGKPMTPRYPVYVISKGRYESRLRLTSRALEKMGVPYHIVVEPQEYPQYAEVIDPAKILTLPSDNFGHGCSIPARNWVWKHAISIGADRHWILDDNIRGFYRFTRNSEATLGREVRVTSGAIFKAAENFCDRYENVAIAGFQYVMFVKRKNPPDAPYSLNTRIYSCILIKNDIPYRWRGRYNEDTDLSLRALKDGWCTVLFNAFLAGKAQTQKMKGGNTDELYKGSRRSKMPESLKKQHPDVARITWKFGRSHHQVDYRPFKKNRLKYKPGVKESLPRGYNNYGMELIELEKLERPQRA